jgi:hypothetical protein
MVFDRSGGCWRNVLICGLGTRPWVDSLRVPVTEGCEWR